jgi:hypothetical protein
MPENTKTMQRIVGAYNQLGAWDVYIQDQFTFAVEHWLSQFIETVTLQANVSLGSNEFILNAGAGALANGEQVLEIRYVDRVSDPNVIRFYQALIVTVDDQGAQVVIGCDTPLDFDLDTTYIESTYLANINLAVTGTQTSPIKFFTSPPDNLKWDLTRTMVTGITATQPDDGKFFDIAALTWGVYFGFENAFVKKYLVNIKANAGFRATAYDVTYSDRTVPQGTYGVSVRKTFGGQDKYGVVVRLTGETNDQFVAYVQDDLTDITQFRIKVMGHEVEN